MQFRLLGPLEVEDDGRVIPLGGAKQRMLFALLLLERGRPVSTDRLTDAIWAGDPPQTAAKSIQVYVSGLRKLLGEGRIVTRERGYELRAAPGECDVDRFDELVRAAAEAPPAEAARLLREALALVRGRPLEDLSLEPWVAPEVSRLDERVLRGERGADRRRSRARPAPRAASRSSRISSPSTRSGSASSSS